ncbi:MAG: glucose-1-phosphate adenylyltransferase, partial [Burkholderiales bacterium]
LPGSGHARAGDAEAPDRRPREGGPALNKDVLALILGGGQGTRLFPLTQRRSKPAVPIGGKYRLIDIPISNCLHADIRRIFVLTQFNSASLNRHVAHAYRMDAFDPGFVEILAAEQTPDNPNWFQGTADAVRQAARHFEHYDAKCYLILAGDHLYRMDYDALVQAHLAHDADITIAAQPVSAADASHMGILKFDTSGRIVGFNEKPRAEFLGDMGRSIPAGSTFAEASAAKPFVASLGIYVFSRKVLFDVLGGEAKDFGRDVLPTALGRYRVTAYLHEGYWADVGTIASFYEANIMLTRPGAPFDFHHPQRPIYTDARVLPAAHFSDCPVRNTILAEGCYLDACSIEDSVIGIRTKVRSGARIRRSVLLGADFYDDDLGLGKDVVLDRVIVDKNARIGDGARLVNEKGVREADGDGYYIRDGIIVVPKEGVIRPGLVV